MYIYGPNAFVLSSISIDYLSRIHGVVSAVRSFKRHPAFMFRTFNNVSHLQVACVGVGENVAMITVQQINIWILKLTLF